MAKQGDNIYKRKDGRWEGRYIKGYKPDGKIQYGFVYGATSEDVKEKLLPLKEEHRSRLELLKGRFKGTLHEWLAFWLEDVAKYELKETTLSSYKHKLESYVVPIIGHVKLGELTEADIRSIVDHLVSLGYKYSTITTIVRVLHSSLNSAVEKKYLGESPCKAVMRQIAATEE